MKDYFEKLINEIESGLVKGIEPQNGILGKAMHYSLSVRGKRLRPLLFLTLIDAFEKNSLKYIDIACAIEYIHTYSLIHDDLPCMDNDDFRRGMPTVHKKFNDAIALLAGDTLLAAAFEKISFFDMPPEKVVNILKILTHSIGKNGMAGGQALDLEFNKNKKLIFKIQRKKTAELIKGTLLSGAEIVNMKEKDKDILEDVGNTIGIAFQMADDLLDIEGDEQKVGKKLHKDKINKSPNSVLYFGKDFVEKKIETSYKKSINMLKEINIDFPPFLSLIKKMVYRDR